MEHYLKSVSEFNVVFANIIKFLSSFLTLFGVVFMLLFRNIVVDIMDVVVVVVETNMWYFEQCIIITIFILWVVVCAVVVCAVVVGKLMWIILRHLRCFVQQCCKCFMVVYA